MAKRRRRNNARRRRALYTVLLTIAALGLMVALLAGSLLWQGEDRPSDEAPGTESIPIGTIHTTTTTTTTTATATTSTKAASPSLLQYSTEGRYVQPDGASWNLLLVNDWNELPNEYEKSVTLVPVGNRNQQVDRRMLASLEAMLSAGAAHGIDVQSGYRSSALQGTLYWRQVNRYLSMGYDEIPAQQQAGAVVKRPGYSEHNCGLAVDLGGSGNFKLEEDFEQTAAFRWLIENCADYGFILRFPKGKESITGVIYEPWHYRYVGVEAARAIMENDLCLEEYLEQTKQ